jgi:hypothetical protein
LYCGIDESQNFHNQFNDISAKNDFNKNYKMLDSINVKNSNPQRGNMKLNQHPGQLAIGNSSKDYKNKTKK